MKNRKEDPFWIAQNSQDENPFIQINKVANSNFNINQQNPQGKTLLHIAAQAGKEEFVKALIDAGANVEIDDNDNNTALHIAIRQRNLQSFSDSSSDNYLHIIEQLIDAKAPLDAKNNNNQYALDYTLFCRDDDVISLLAEKNISTIGDIPILHQAIRAKNSNFIDKLIGAGFDPNEKDDNHNIALHIAVQENRLGIVRKLVSMDNKDIQNNSNETALHIAAHKGSPIITKELLQEASKPTIQNKDGDTALNLAIIANHTKTAKKLIDAMDVDDLTLKNNTGKTPLHLAVEADNIEIVKELLFGDRIKLIIEEDNKGNKAPDLAKSNNQSLVGFLQKKYSEYELLEQQREEQKEQKEQNPNIDWTCGLYDMIIEFLKRNDDINTQSQDILQSKEIIQHKPSSSAHNPSGHNIFKTAWNWIADCCTKR